MTHDKLGLKKTDIQYLAKTKSYSVYKIECSINFFDKILDDI